MTVSHKNVSALIPHHVDLIVPGVDAENRTDTDHVVLLVTKVLNELMFDRDTREKLEVFGGLLQHFVCRIEAIH